MRIDGTFGGTTATGNARAAEALGVIDEQLRLMAEHMVMDGQVYVRPSQCMTESLFIRRRS